MGILRWIIACSYRVYIYHSIKGIVYRTWRVFLRMIWIQKVIKNLNLNKKYILWIEVPTQLIRPWLGCIQWNIVQPIWTPWYIYIFSVFLYLYTIMSFLPLQYSLMWFLASKRSLEALKVSKATKKFIA